ncbi:MAG: hypothetical protein K6G88_05655 [Lachnospiraceae bacterium]|nr:hypothetical protein [Lachnospiraceae bacterium]
MKYPELIPKSMCKTPVEVTVYGEGLTETGGPVIAFEGELLCNWQDNAHTVLTADKKLVTLSGTALIRGDIAPDLAVLSSGVVIVNGVERKLYKGTKARNPDGTVNYTKLEVE